MRTAELRANIMKAHDVDVAFNACASIVKQADASGEFKSKLQDGVYEAAFKLKGELEKQYNSLRVKIVKASVFLIATGLLAGCASAPLPAPYSQAVAPVKVVGVDPDKMAYKADTADYWDTSMPKAGDCEDYALGWARKLGTAGRNGVIALVRTHYDAAHAVLFAGGNVYDQRHEFTSADMKPGTIICNLASGQLGILGADKRAIDFTNHTPNSRIGNNCYRAAAELRQ